MKYPQAASGASGARCSPPPTSKRSLGADRVSLPQIPASSPAAQRTEQLARLAYELLDAHVDTVPLVHGPSSHALWQAHLRYLRDPQRTGREILSGATNA
jgi:hypothetical protein